MNKRLDQNLQQKIRKPKIIYPRELRGANGTHGQKRAIQKKKLTNKPYITNMSGTL
jgi:hypothetical protein